MTPGPRYVGTTELPWAHGFYRGPDVVPTEVDPVGGKARWTLSGMAGDFRFFSHAVLLAAGFRFDPVALHWAESGLPAAEAPLWVDLGRTVLKGLPPPLDRVVFACPLPHAPGLIRFLDRVGGRAATGAVWESVHQAVPVVDWALVATMSVVPPAPPTVPIALYGWGGSGGLYAWRPPADPWRDPLCLTFRPPPPPKNPKATKPPRRPFSTS